MNKTIKVSFEIEDSYAIGSFRNFIKLLLSDDKFNVFIISNNDNSAEITTIGQSLGLPSSNIIICNFTEDKLQAIRDNKINIHFDNLQSFVLLADEITDAYGILVTANYNKFYLKPDYLLVFEKNVKLIEDNE